MRLNTTFTPQTVAVEINPATETVSIGNPVTRDYVERDPYTGDYEVTPSSERQVLRTKNLRMTDDITIKPVPSYYGIIIWDGSTITVR